MSYIPIIPSKTTPDSRPKWAKSIPVFRQKLHKHPTDGAAHTYMAYIREYPPPHPCQEYHKDVRTDAQIITCCMFVDNRVSYKTCTNWTNSRILIQLELNGLPTN